ncbi:MAG: rod shape-determining protein MreC [Ruminococcaceae bacterium]|nr:rod shape-determining protein MreC [Oscillospiraceae bacterium]
MFKRNSFKIVAAVIAVLAGMALYAGVNGKLTTLPQEILGAAAVPFKQATAKISDKMSVWKDRNINIDQIIAENEALKAENEKLLRNQIDYDKIKIENDQYKEFLNIKEENPEYEIAAASVIGRDGLEKFYSFTIDAGRDEGVEENDVVLSSVGVVGVVVETGPNYSRVSTILNPAVNVACFVSSTRDTGVVNGDSAYSQDGKTIIRYLPKNTQAKEGDIISTTGMGEIFPKDLIVGIIEKVETDSSGNYNYAVVNPISEIAEVKTVFVIKDY